MPCQSITRCEIDYLAVGLVIKKTLCSLPRHNQTDFMYTFMGKPIELLDVEFDQEGAYIIKARFKESLEHLDPLELDELNRTKIGQNVSAYEFARQLHKNLGPHSGAYVLIRVSLEAYESNYLN